MCRIINIEVKVISKSLQLIAVVHSSQKVAHYLDYIELHAFAFFGSIYAEGRRFFSISLHY